MTYFQEKLQQLLVSIARKFNDHARARATEKERERKCFEFVEERDTYRNLYLKEHDRRIAAELRLKESNNPMV